jgi:cytidine deaminase
MSSALGADSKLVVDAFQMALEAQQRAYAPYSTYKVGAAVKARSHDQIVAAGNVENACYPAGICAEGNAINQLVSLAGGSCTLEFVVVVTPNKKAAAPCGICRQVMSEFADHETQIFLANEQGIQRQVSMAELLPLSYTKDQLRAGQLK